MCGQKLNNWLSYGVDLCRNDHATSRQQTSQPPRRGRATRGPGGDEPDYDEDEDEEEEDEDEEDEDEDEDEDQDYDEDEDEDEFMDDADDKSGAYR